MERAMTSATLENDLIGREPLGSKNMKTHKYKPGLSLIEMIIVVGVIMLLSTITIMLVGRIDTRTKENQVNTIFVLLDSALQEYNDYWKSFPDPNQSPYPTHSAALYGRLYLTPSCHSIIEKIGDAFVRNNPNTTNMPEIYDPWGTILDYKYVAGDNFPRLVSAGPDKTFGTADDITNKREVD
jgi:type II secretory pathway pseudopilin PulG